MSENHVIVVAELAAKEGRADELKTHLLALVAPTRDEEGCIRYDLNESDAQAGRFVFLEEWTSREALDRHMQTPHFGAFAAGTKELLSEPPRILTCRHVA